MTRTGIDRVLKFAFELAMKRPRRHLTSATKSNGISITMPFWDDRVAAMAPRYPQVSVDKFHIDILTAHFVQRPEFFDVVVASNLFGDILSDLGPACTGTIGIAPSANLNPDRTFPVAVRTGARFGARHRRAGHRQSDRADLECIADAGLARPCRGCGVGAGCDRTRPDRRAGACSADSRHRRRRNHRGPRPRHRRGDLSAHARRTQPECPPGAGRRSGSAVTRQRRVADGTVLACRGRTIRFGVRRLNACSTDCGACHGTRRRTLAYHRRCLQRGAANGCGPAGRDLRAWRRVAAAASSCRTSRASTWERHRGSRCA